MCGLSLLLYSVGVKSVTIQCVGYVCYYTVWGLLLLYSVWVKSVTIQCGG